MLPLAHLKLVLHVEDEMLISMDTDDALHAGGVSKIIHAATVQTALDTLSKEAIDAAIVDMQLRDGDSYPILEELKSAGIPFIIVSGAPIVPADENYYEYRLDKPVSSRQLVTALERITSPHQPVVSAPRDLSDLGQLNPH